VLDHDVWFPRFGERRFALVELCTACPARGTGIAETLLLSRPTVGECAMDTPSTAIHEIDYDAERSKLVVRLVSGEAFVYVGVPGDVHRSFCQAPSKGRFFQAEIRDRYPYNRLDG
jgi:lysyl-tRNA synthetase class 2